MKFSVEYVLTSPGSAYASPSLVMLHLYVSVSPPASVAVTLNATGVPSVIAVAGRSTSETLVISGATLSTVNVAVAVVAGVSASSSLAVNEMLLSPGLPAMPWSSIVPRPDVVDVGKSPRNGLLTSL